MASGARRSLRGLVSAEGGLVQPGRRMGFSRVLPRGAGVARRPESVRHPHAARSTARRWFQVQLSAVFARTVRAVYALAGRTRAAGVYRTEGDRARVADLAVEPG